MDRHVPNGFLCIARDFFCRAAIIDADFVSDLQSPALTASSLEIITPCCRAVNAGTATLNSTSTLGIGLGGTACSTQYGDITVSGIANLAGTLAVSFINSFTPVADNRFDIHDFSTHTDTFSSVQLPTPTGSLFWNTSLLYSLDVISVEDSNFLAGDFNRDHHVTAADILPAMKALGGSRAIGVSANRHRSNTPINLRTCEANSNRRLREGLSKSGVVRCFPQDICICPFELTIILP